MNLSKNQFLNFEILRKSKLFIFFATLVSSIIFSSEPAYSTKEFDKCSAITLPDKISLSGGAPNLNTGDLTGGGTGETGCTISPQTFKVVAHELGICTAGNNPFSTSGLDTSGCFTLWSSDAGEEYNLVDANGEPELFALDETTVNEPPLGTYKYAYIIIDDTIKIKATLTLADETWKTSAESDHVEYRETARDESSHNSIGKVSTDSADEFPTRVGYFDTGCYAENISVGGTVISGLMLQSNKTAVATQSENQNNFGDTMPYCVGSKYIAGVQTLSTPIDFTADTTSGTLSFDTTETAVWVGAYDYGSRGTNRGVDGGPGRIFFDIGPFILRFTVN